ncbi:type IV pilus assembly protein PilO [Allochromatium warmingii]|uniref:Type IV pilus assembly protein PilO n=1 Tax=Allochromatium warmingii TaxID=61595 RepID=A0A1H3DJI2_ALLWA|nr:type 4a pilus biogenesis protein PilO [Allochromatium warmingii]SDX66672.1 type IV pilus assembly protein PilO [Allochromatium warmingii]
MDLNELNQIDFNDFGEWPKPIKAVAIGLVCIVLAGLAYHYDTSPQRERLAAEQRAEQAALADLTKKQQKAANLENYRNQLADMEQSFGAMLKQLPNRTEVAALLVDVSQTGLANGLEFELFQPNNEATREFYAELPIQIRVRGQYHDFGRFVSGLAALPRIVTIHNVRIQGGSDKAATDSLQAIVKTYRYLQDEAK